MRLCCFNCDIGFARTVSYLNFVPHPGTIYTWFFIFIILEFYIKKGLNKNEWEIAKKLIISLESGKTFKMDMAKQNSDFIVRYTSFVNHYISINY